MLKPLLACPLPLRSLPICSFPSLQTSSARVRAPSLALAHTPVLVQALTENDESDLTKLDIEEGEGLEEEGDVEVGKRMRDDVEEGRRDGFKSEGHI
jgi:hypothetical protein